MCGRNGDYVGTETWLREKRRTWGKVCLCCVLKCVVQYSGNDATFFSATTNTDRLLSHEINVIQHNRQFDAIVCRGVKVFWNGVIFGTNFYQILF